MTRMLAVLLLGLAACAEVTIPLPAPVEFSYRQLRTGQYPVPRVSAEGGDGRITVRGELGTPDPCQTLHAVAARTSTRVVLRVTIRPKDGGCITVAGAFAYDATIRALPPGTYRLRVAHRFAGTGHPGPQTVLERTLTVR